MKITKIKTKNFFGLNNETEYNLEETDERYSKVIDFLLGKLDIKEIPTYKELNSICEKKEVIIKAEAIFDCGDKVQIVRTKIKLKRRPLYSTTLWGEISSDETKIYVQKFDCIEIEKHTQKCKHLEQIDKNCVLLLEHFEKEYENQTHKICNSQMFLKNAFNAIFTKYLKENLEEVKHD